MLQLSLVSWYADVVAEMTTKRAEEFDFHQGFIVQEWLWDDDVDNDGTIRQMIENSTGEELVDEDYDGPVDGVIIWWRDGDEEDDLADTIVDASTSLEDEAPVWVLTPKPGRTGAPSPGTLPNAAKTAGMNVAMPITISSDWNATRLRAFGKGKQS